MGRAGSARKPIAPPTCRASASSQSGFASIAATTAGCATSRLRPGARTPRGAAARGPRTRRGPAPARRSEARARGRTIWTKPKPLTAVRSNGCGRTASIAAAAAWRAALLPRGRQVDPDRPADVEAADGLGRFGRAGDRELVGGRKPSTSIRVIAGVGEIRSSPPANADDAGSRFVDQIVPAGIAERIVRRRERQLPPAGPRAAAMPRRLVANARERPFPRLRARDGCTA